MLWGVSAQNCFVFQKKKIPKFWSIEPIFRSIKIAIKNFGQPLSISIDARLILDQSKNFQSIKPNFWSIENHIESFLKILILACSTYFSKKFQTLSLSSIGQGSNPIFLSFSSNSLQGFSPLRFFSFLTLRYFVIHVSCFTTYWFIFMSYSWYISLFCVLWNKEIIFVLLLFSTHVFMCLLSISRKIQVDSAMLLSTLATNR